MEKPVDITKWTMKQLRDRLWLEENTSVERRLGIDPGPLELRAEIERRTEPDDPAGLTRYH